MIRYRVPATSANLGIGFDCLGMALNLYNVFEIEESDRFSMEGFFGSVSGKNSSDSRALEKNLFYQAYKETCETLGGALTPLSVKLKSEIPMSRGLGSSSALIVGGIYAYYFIRGLAPDKAKALEIATKIEGHPDNVTPCIFGGLCASHGSFYSRFEVSDEWKLYVLIPNYEVRTSEARKVIRQEIALHDAVSNISSALIGVDALVHFDVSKIGLLNGDTLHEPYRKQLIKDYEPCKEEALRLGAKAFLISGSGSTMLAISDKELSMDFPGIVVKEVRIDQEGATWLANC